MKSIAFLMTLSLLAVISLFTGAFANQTQALQLNPINNIENLQAPEDNLLAGCTIFCNRWGFCRKVCTGDNGVRGKHLQLFDAQLISCAEPPFNPEDECGVTGCIEEDLES